MPKNSINATSKESRLFSVDGGSDLCILLRRSDRAKKTRIVVSADKIEVIAPTKVPERSINSFVEAQQSWIRDAIKRVRERSDAIKAVSPRHYVDGVCVPYQGALLPLTIKHAAGKHIKILLHEEQQFLVYLPSIHQENSSEQIKSALEQWMKQQARHIATQLIAKHSQKQKLIPRCLRIKTQKSRWGSCGPNNDINLNWLLILGPPIVLEYVVVHELCHIVHKNHSKDFWNLVSDHMPDYSQHRRWLKLHGASLMQGL